MQIMRTIKGSLIDGEGINYVIYTAGCPHKCKGCHNPSTWSRKNGHNVSLEKIKEDIIDDPLITGITLSGGEPMRQWAEVKKLAEWARENGYKVNIYTGYIMRNRSGVFDRLCRKHIQPAFILKKEDLQLFDYIIDGPYIQEEKDLALPFRGSRNQRLLTRGVDF